MENYSSELTSSNDFYHEIFPFEWDCMMLHKVDRDGNVDVNVIDCNTGLQGIPFAGFYNLLLDKGYIKKDDCKVYYVEFRDNPEFTLAVLTQGDGNSTTVNIVPLELLISIGEKIEI